MRLLKNTVLCMVPTLMFRLDPFVFLPQSNIPSPFPNALLFSCFASLVLFDTVLFLPTCLHFKMCYFVAALRVRRRRKIRLMFHENT